MNFDQPATIYLLAAFCGYAAGSIPFGLVLSKLAGLGDVRAIGSGNIGATNVLRTGSKKLAIVTLLCDMLKGFFPVVIFMRWGLDAAVSAGLLALIGHMFPVWLGFKGGKGVATFIGVLCALSWPLALAFCAVWLIVALLFKFSSLSALVATALTPVGAMLFAVPALVVPLIAMGALIILKHRENIQRLIKNKEPKIKLRS